MSKPVKPITAQRLENVALHYLQRFASSSANLKRVLMRRVERAARAAAPDEAEAVRAHGAGLVEELVARYLRSGLLDDAAFAQAKARSLHRRGASLRAIRQGLALRGVDADTAEAGIGGLAEEFAEPDLAAALALARRRRLGPFRPPAQRAEQRARDLAALARAGFSYDVAARVVDAEDPSRLEEQ
jgi:regulatory protein